MKQSFRRHFAGRIFALESDYTAALFGLAKTRLKPEEFTKVAGAVPGMHSLLAGALK